MRRKNKSNQQLKTSYKPDSIILHNQNLYPGNQYYTAVIFALPTRCLYYLVFAILPAKGVLEKAFPVFDILST